MNSQDPQANAFQGTIFDAYDYYKRNYHDSESFISSTGFESVQNLGANIASRFRPTNMTGATTLEGTQTMTTETTATTTATTATKPSIFNASFFKGLLIGVGVAYVATNPTIQKAVVSGAVNVFSALQGSIEEMKEQIQDAKEELSQVDE